MISDKIISNWIDGQIQSVENKEFLDKYNPATGHKYSSLVNSTAEDVKLAVIAAQKGFNIWSVVTPIERGRILSELVKLMEQTKNDLASIVAIETGKPLNDAIGEVNASILQGKYFAGEGMRLYGRSLTSGMPGKYSHTVRQPIGIAGLIVPANTPIANIAWKLFPALICGNSVILKASEDAPETALRIAELSKEAGLPDGVFNVLQGKGDSVGVGIVESTSISIISFTGSTSTGRWIAKTGGERLARVSLELGGKNPFVVCDDADLDAAVQWAVLSAFSNAGQRCAAGSRILIFENIYDQFVDKLVEKTKTLKLGVTEGCNLGPVINSRQQKAILAAIERAKNGGGKVLVGGKAPQEISLKNGFYIEPTLIDGLTEEDELSTKEVFGPVATLHRVSSIAHALKLANSTEYGLTAAIHTKNVDRAMWFAQRVRSGVVNINIGTFGSEAHMPFGGMGASGNGTREPGVEALDVYSELKNISFLVRESAI
ncbi:aldehyde dehydrogenase family protein [Pedobacter sp. P351]|uniref:aldehyde dehydrogenase family protein n=1 Tax=Pedobacter superstes TaxID=3133441 RepID=UPI0030B05414